MNHFKECADLVSRLFQVREEIERATRETAEIQRRLEEMHPLVGKDFSRILQSRAGKLGSRLQDLMTEDGLITEDLVKLFGVPEETVYAIVGDYAIAVDRSVIVEQVADLTEAERVRYENL